MFFILSKILALGLRPLTWATLFAIGAVIARNSRKRRLFARATAITLVVFTNPLLINTLAGGWETGQHSPEEIGGPYAFGIVLGGYTNTGAKTPPGVYNASVAASRLLSAIQLYHQGHFRRFLLSGGSGALGNRQPKEAVLVRDYLLTLGIPDSAIVVEARSRTTRENALYSKVLLDSLAPHQPALLITSTWHMPRAQRCFTKLGVKTVPFGTDFVTTRAQRQPWKWMEPSWEVLMRWDLLIKEWIGFVGYRVKGYI